MTDNLDKAADNGAEHPGGEGRRRVGPFDARKAATLTISAVILVAALSSVVILTQPEETVKVVAILAAAGAYSHTDEMELSLKMAVDDLNRWGGIGGTQIELIIETTLADNKSIAETFSAAEQEHRPLVYVTAGCDLMNVLGPLAEESQVPLIGMGSTPGLTAGFEWVYRFTIPASNEATSAIKLFDELDITSLGILHSLSPHSCGIHDALLDALVSFGGTVVSEGFEAEDEIPEKISNLSDSQAIFCVGSCEELAVLIPAIQDSGFAGYRMASSCGSTPLIRDVFEGEEVYVSAPLIYKPENINARDFIVRFESTHNVSATHHGAVIHDLVYLVQGLLEGHELTRENLKQELDNDFIISGVLGVMRIDAGVHDFELQVYPAVISEGELRYL